MRRNDYLHWMSLNTETKWCNDSAMIGDIKAALESGAIGCTSNPPLTYQVLNSSPEIFKDELSEISTGTVGDDRVVELIGVVVRYISKIFYGMFDESNGLFGYIRAQVQPNLFADAESMLEMGRKFASWGKNIMVKIPGTSAGIWVLEELASMGIPTNPTVCVTVSQIASAAEAYERGVKRAIMKGIKPAPSTSAIVMGRLQDYLSVLNEERNAGLSVYDLECAALSVVKRCYQLFVERGYRQVLMPAAFRCVRQVEQMVGGKVVMTIHPKTQDMIIEAEANGTIKRNILIHNPVDMEAIERVKKALPEFELAYEPGALEEKDFETYGGTVMTLNGFDTTGWQKLLKMDIVK